MRTLVDHAADGGFEPKATDAADHMDGCFAEREGS